MKSMSFDTDEKATSLVSRPNNKYKVDVAFSLYCYLNSGKGKRGELRFYVWFGDG